MDTSQLSTSVLFVLVLVLAAEAANGWTDAPCGTSSAVASGVLSSRTALWMSAIGNSVGLIVALLVGAKVAQTVGTGIVRPDVISVSSIGVAMVTTVLWSSIAARLGLPVSKTHSLFAALAGIGVAQGGFEALLPASGKLADSGWVAAGIGAFCALMCGSALAWFLSSIIQTFRLNERMSEKAWRKLQIVTVLGVTSGHGFNDGLKYVGIFTLVLFKAGVIKEFHVFPIVVVMCALVMGVGTLLGGWLIHRTLDTLVNGQQSATQKKSYQPYMGVSAESVVSFLIWQTGFIGIPTSTTHSTVAAMAGAKSATSFTQSEIDEKKSRVHISSLVRIVWGWIVTYMLCGGAAWLLAKWSL